MASCRCFFPIAVVRSSLAIDAHRSIPKSKIEPREALLEAVMREFQEEIGTTPAGQFCELAPIKQKVVHAWASHGDFNPSAIVSNTFTIEWPPKSERQMELPEMDPMEFFGAATASWTIKASADAVE